MEVKDLLVTPIFLIIIYAFAYFFKNRVKNNEIKKYFIPGLTVKLFSAVFLGLVYQFYYGDGDTFNYFRQGNIVTQALVEEPILGLKLIFSDGSYIPETLKYSSKLRWYRFPTEFFIVKLSGVLGILSWQSYTAIALLFASFSFAGIWAMYTVFCKIRPNLKDQFAIAFLFIPSLFFWGSGLLKDSIMIGALGFLLYSLYNLFFKRRRLIISLLLFLISFYILYTIRIYILIAFITPCIIWMFLEFRGKIRNPVIRMLIMPIVLAGGLSLAYVTTLSITRENQKYNFDNLAKRTKINADYLYRVSVRQQGSAYYIGELDGTFQSMIRISPQAIFVSLFRPFPWEVKNLLMLLSSIESFIILLFTLLVFFKKGLIKTFRIILGNPVILFCILFSIILAFAIGLNSYNFGTLVRYKIPLLPFYLSALYMIYHHQKEVRTIPEPSEYQDI